MKIVRRLPAALAAGALVLGLGSAAAVASSGDHASPTRSVERTSLDRAARGHDASKDRGTDHGRSRDNDPQRSADSRAHDR